MIETLAPRERRVLAIGILLIVLALGYVLVIAPLLNGIADRRAERAELLDTYVRQQRVIETRRYWQRQAASQRTDRAAFGLLTPSRATATEVSKDRITAFFAQGTVRGLRDVPAPDGWVRVRVEARLTLPEVAQSLRRIQAARPYMVVTSLVIDAEQAFTTGQLSPLDVRLELSVPFTPVAAN